MDAWRPPDLPPAFDGTVDGSVAMPDQPDNHDRIPKPPRRSSGPPPIRPPARPAPRREETGDFDFQTLSRSHQQDTRQARKRTAGRREPIILAAVALTVLVAATVFVFGGRKSLVIRPPGVQEVDELELLELPIAVEVLGIPKERLCYSLSDAPEGAQIDSDTGVLTWRPSESQGGLG